MTLDEIAAYNAEWLDAWSSADAARVAAYYSQDCVFKDPQTAAGLTGRAALEEYLRGLFAAMPPTRYKPDEVWPIPGGYCGRWYATMGEGESAPRLRGFDLVLLRGREIVLNEVYVHQL